MINTQSIPPRFKPRLLAIIFMLGGLVWSACTATTDLQPSRERELKTVNKSSTYFERSFEAPDQLSPHLKNVWNLSLPGLPTDLVLAKNGRDIWVATVPDPEDSTKTGLHLLHVASSGKKISDLRVKQQIKSLVVSAEGDLLILNNYLDQMLGFSPKGKMLWEARATCRPIIVTGKKQELTLVCHHDDDARPEVSYEVFDSSGKLLGDHREVGDALLIHAYTKNQILIAYPGGRLTQIKVEGAQSLPVSEVLVAGEVVDLSTHANGFVVVLSRGHQKEKILSHISIIQVSEEYDAKNSGMKLVAAWDHEEVLDQIEAGQGEKNVEVVAYGNSSKSGQVLVGFSVIAGVPQLNWVRREPRASAYNHQMVFAGDGVVVALEEARSDSRRSFAMGYLWDGSLNFGAPLRAKDAGYVYSLAYDPVHKFLVAATDDAHLRGYHLRR